MELNQSCRRLGISAQAGHLTTSRRKAYAYIKHRETFLNVCLCRPVCTPVCVTGGHHDTMTANWSAEAEIANISYKFAKQPNSDTWRTILATAV